jgi:ParB-like chromosome segregation protein Spo0J
MNKNESTNLSKSAQIEQWPLDRLIEYARNPRKNDHAVEKIAAAIHEFGFRVPILARSDGLVVDGHLRLKAARKLGMETVPVLLADDMSDTQVRAFRLSVNKMAELAEWDIEMLALEIEDLKLLDFDITMTGFEIAELENIGVIKEEKTIVPESSAKEIDADDFQMELTCPRCGFEFDDKRS